MSGADVERHKTLMQPTLKIVVDYGGGRRQARRGAGALIQEASLKSIPIREVREIVKKAPKEIREEVKRTTRLERDQIERDYKYLLEVEGRWREIKPRATDITTKFLKLESEKRMEEVEREAFNKGRACVIAHVLSATRCDVGKMTEEILRSVVSVEGMKGEVPVKRDMNENVVR